MGRPRWSLQSGESGTWARRQSFSDLGCHILSEKGKCGYRFVLGSCKEGSNDLFPLKEKNTAGPPGVGEKVMGRVRSRVLSRPHCISIPVYKTRVRDIKDQLNLKGS